ncbi:hypothetical protein MZM54_03650 [[Brevibacterium] frigoritolerans]|nr:hypothetical protein [Peribacillus frigoritolerans]
MKSKKVIIFTLIVILCGSYLLIQKINQKVIKVEKDGIELVVKLDKKIYSMDESIGIKASAKNISNKVFEYRTGDGCDNGFGYGVSSTIKRLYDVVRDGQSSRICTMAVGEASLRKGQKINMKIELTPRELTQDKYLYKGDELNVSIAFVGRDVTFKLPVDIERKNKDRDIPSTAKEAAEYYKNNKVIREWMEKEPLNRDRLVVRSYSDRGDIWEIQYYTNEGKGGHIELEVESDTGAIIKTIHKGWSDSVEEEIIIPTMVLRTAFKEELKDNPNKTFRISVQSSDFQKELNDEIPDGNEEEKNTKHIENIKKHNGKVTGFSKWTYTYEVKMKGSEILKMAEDEEWESIRKVDKSNKLF